MTIRAEGFLGIISAWLIGIGWIAGIVLAKGFWLTITAITVPFYAWYLLVEQAMKLAGFY